MVVIIMYSSRRVWFYSVVWAGSALTCVWREGDDSPTLINILKLLISEFISMELDPVYMVVHLLQVSL